MSALPSIAEAKHAYLFWEAALSSDEVRQLREWRHAMHALKLEDESVRTRIPITDYRDMKFVQRQHEAQKAEHARIRAARDELIRATEAVVIARGGPSKSAALEGARQIMAVYEHAAGYLQSLKIAAEEGVTVESGYNEAPSDSDASSVEDPDVPEAPDVAAERIWQAKRRAALALALYREFVDSDAIYIYMEGEKNPFRSYSDEKDGKLLRGMGFHASAALPNDGLGPLVYY